MLKLGGERRRLEYSWRAARELESALELKNLFDLWSLEGPFGKGEIPSTEHILLLLRAGLMHEETYSTDTLATWLEESGYDMQRVAEEIVQALSESTLLPENAKEQSSGDGGGKKKKEFSWDDLFVGAGSMGIKPQEALRMTPRQYHCYAKGWRIAHGIDSVDMPAMPDGVDAEKIRQTWADDAERRRKRDGLD